MPVDPDGPRVDMAGLLAASAPVRLAYVVPTFHNPTGATMPEARRRDLARAAGEFGFQVVEDLDTRLDPRRRCATTDRCVRPGDRVITIGSLSKLAWGGLRIGWIRAPRADIDRLVAGKIVADHATSLITRPSRPRSSTASTRSWPERSPLPPSAAIVTQALAERLPSGWTMPKGGLSLWIRLPDADAVQFSRLAARHGVIVRPGPLASPDGGFGTTSGSRTARTPNGSSRASNGWRPHGPSTRLRHGGSPGRRWPSASDGPPRTRAQVAVGV